MKAITAVATLAVLSLTAASASVRPAKAGDPDSLVVHEWGTFTSIAGEDGRAVEWFPLDGQRDLPCFVERFEFGKVGLGGTVRMETPVLYFYARQPTTIDVSVRFRQGLITEWFPHAAVTPSKIGPSSLRIAGFWSTARWKGITVTPGAREQFPQESAASHYYAARKTDAAPLQLGSQQEKFLFYRGVGNFGVPLTATAAADGRVTVKSADAGAQVGTVILFESRNGRLGYDARRSAESHITLEKPQLSRDITSLTSELRQILISHGLYEKEARAMIETWRDSWFEEGTRLFYIVPSGTVDGILPLAINPRPAAIARVFGVASSC